MAKELEPKKMYRRVPFIYFVLAASLLVTAVSSIGNAIDGLNPLAGYVTGWYNNSTVTVVNATYNSSEVDYLVTLKENGSRVCTAANGVCNGSNSTGDNNYTLTCSATGTDSLLFNCTRFGGTNFSFVVDNYVIGYGLNVSGRTVSVANLTACNSVTEYSVWNGSHWLCDNDGGGGGGTVTSVGINVNGSAVVNVTAEITTSGNITLSFPDATVLQSGFATATQITSLNAKALAGNCVGDNGTHVNVTMNATTAGVQCVEVLKTASAGTGNASWNESYADTLYWNVNGDTSPTGSYRITYNDTQNVFQIINNGTGTSNIALDVLQYNADDTAVGVRGNTTSRSVLKVSHEEPSSSDSNAAALGLFLNGVTTDAQGLYINVGNSTGNWVHITDTVNSYFVIDKATGGADVIISSNSSNALLVQNTAGTDRFRIDSNAGLGYLGVVLRPNTANTQGIGQATVPFATGYITNLNTTNTNATTFYQNYNRVLDYSGLDTSNITSGQLADAYIASADKWNHAGSSNLTTVVVENITGVNVTNGTTHTLSIRVSDGNTFNVTFDDTTGGGGAQNITFNTTFTQYGFTYMENATQIGTNSLLQKQNATTVFVNNTLNTTYLVQNNFSSPYAFQTQFTKCWESEMGGTATAGVSSTNAAWGLQTVSAGAVVGTASGGDDHPLITSLRDSTTANGGVMVLLSSVTAGEFTPKAGDELRAIVRFSSGKPGVVTGRIGFSDTQSITAPTDGCYLEMNATATNIAQFVCAAAGTRTPNATTLAFSNATWYGVGVKYLNTTAANATIWGDTGTVLLSVGLRSGINTAASNPQLIVTQSTTDAAATIMDVDWIGACRQYKPQRAWSYGQ